MLKDSFAVLVGALNYLFSWSLNVTVPVSCRPRVHVRSVTLNYSGIFLSSDLRVFIRHFCRHLQQIQQPLPRLLPHCPRTVDRGYVLSYSA